MFNYFIRRLLVAIPVLLGVTIINFYIVNLAPGDAIDLMVDPGLSAADLQRQREDLGLNDPIHVRYVKWLGHLKSWHDFKYSFLQAASLFKRTVLRLS